MELRNRVVVVTGGASGIGRALCRRFAAEGARAVVVADCDAEGGARVAAEVGGLAVPTDVAREEQVRELVERATERFGPIDLFCSNAGVAAGPGLGDGASGPFAPDEAWRQSWTCVSGSPGCPRLQRGTSHLLPASAQASSSAFSASGVLQDGSSTTRSVR